MPVSVNMGQFKAALNAALEKRMLRVEKLFKYVGEQCVNTARDSHRYKDRTGNLTSSIGYVVVRDGVIIDESRFNQVKGADGRKAKNKAGSLEGREFAERLAVENNKGLVLIVVAGMKYAKYVNDRGLDVTDSAEDEGRRLIPELLGKLK